MAQLNITIPDQHVQRVVRSLCAAGGYQERTAANAKRALIDYIKRTVRDEELALARAELSHPDTDGIAS